MRGRGNQPPSGCPWGPGLWCLVDNIVAQAALSVGQDKPSAEQAIGLPAVSWRADDATAWSPASRRPDHFMETDEKSIVPKAVIFTPVTLSDQPMVAVEYHIGMAGMLSARRASASWYFWLA